MPTYTGLLVRDSLQDQGVLPSPGYPYTSPDIVCVQQNAYSNPAAVLGTTQSYGTDPNLGVVVSQNNNFYVRAKNLGAVAQGGTMWVYWSKASLLLTPNLWFNRPITALLNKVPQNYVALPPVAAGQISVGAIPFNWTPPTISANDHFCLIGAVNTVPPNVWPPATAPTFSSPDQFVMWLRNSRNICWRNLSLVSNPRIPQWDRLDSFSNPWVTPMAMLVSAQCTNVPVGTTVQLLCSALGINTSVVTTSLNQTVYSPGLFCPPEFNGLVETMARLPGSSVWPAGATITTTVYIGLQATSPAARFAHNFRADDQHPAVVATRQLVRRTTADTAAGVLVAIGNTTTAYQPTARSLPAMLPNSSFEQ